MKILRGSAVRVAFIITLLILIIPISDSKSKPLKERILMGAEQMDEYLPLLKGKNVGLVVNHTSLIGTFKEVHLLDSLLALKVNVKKIFCPEHGFRGTASAGENIESGIDQKTGLPIVSLYGDHKKPLPEDLEGLDVLIFDIQDVGARFYTYISTMHYVMEACAENGKQVIVLDRPNPNGFYVDGPVLEPEYKSFVGMHPGVPIVHGMTVGEYALMINGESWLEGGGKCDLTVVPCENYNHNVFYKLRTKPSPNLPNMTAIYLYPSLCLFEGTVMSVGRGTDKPFQVFGHPDFGGKGFTFTPEANEGAKNPKFEGKECHGVDLSNMRKDDFRQMKYINLGWLLDSYTKFKDKEQFFTPFFEKLAGTAKLREQIEQGLTEDEIRYSWQRDLEAFHKIRKKYLLYQDYN